MAYSAISQQDSVKFIFNELRAKLQFHSGAWILGSASLGIQTELASDPAVLWTLSETGSRSPSIEAGATATFTAQYPSSGSANTARAVDFWQDLTATTDYLANDSADGTGTNRTANITVTETKRAQSMDIALANGHSSTVYITKLQARGNAVTANDEFEVTASDSTSQTTFGKRTYPHPGKFVPDAEEAQNWATFHLAAWKDPVPLLKLTLVGNRSTATLTDIMTREISDLVTVTANNDAGLGINETFFVESLHHSVDAELNHRATLTLSQASGYAGFFVLNSSALGITTRLAY